MSHFIFMLTHNDTTLDDARKIFSEVADLNIPFIGFKDIGLSVPELKALAGDIQANGQGVMLELVSQTKEDELLSLRAALDIGVDYVLGGTHVVEATKILAGSGIKYMPFPGKVVGHPSKLIGTSREIMQSARELASLRGVDGLDLLAYRFEGDVHSLIADVIKNIDIPVIVAGSIASVERIETVCKLGAWGFTIGGAIYDHMFPGEKTVRGQVQVILEAVESMVIC